MTHSEGMKRLLWATDTHLDHVCVDGIPKDDRFESFIDEANKLKPDFVVLTGDISSAKYVVTHLKILEQELQCDKIFYVLGNHDYYGGSISGVRKQNKEELGDSNKLVYLSSFGKVPLTDSSMIVGHDGWYDGQYADWFSRRTVLMNDYLVISEFRERWFAEENRDAKTFMLMQKLAGECEYHIMQHLDAAAKLHDTVVFATHVPPFRENSTYNGKMSDDSWMPCFSSKLAGDALIKVANANPKTQFLVLSGHSHGKALYKPTSNMLSLTGFANYGQPSASFQLFDIE